MEARFELSMDHTRMDVDAILALLRTSYWCAAIRREVLERAIKNSIVIGAFDPNGKQIAFARVVTDRATFAWLCDVIVNESWRGKGVGRAMVRTLIAHPELQTLRRWCLATKDAQGVYEPLGFEPVATGRWFEKRLDPSVWSDASVKLD